jgi:hypothetical protein
MIRADQEAYHELSYYTLAHSQSSFIHQHVVDAFAAQHADVSSKPITVAFALIGLYLHVEKNYSGKDVQDTHMRLARQRRQWPRLRPPDQRGGITVHDVVAAPAGPERDAMIHKWCVSVWDAWKPERESVAALLKDDPRAGGRRISG